MEKVTDDDINGNISLFIFPGHLQQLFLIPVTQLALPEAHSIFRHHGHLARSIRIGTLDFIRRIPCGNPVIHLLCAFRIPLCGVGGKAHTADSRIVPQEAIALIRQHEGNACLGISVGQLKIAVFYIQDILLVLSHTEQLFLRLGSKGHGQVKISSDDGFEETVFLIQGAALSRFL